MFYITHLYHFNLSVYYAKENNNQTDLFHA